MLFAPCQQRCLFFCGPPVLSVFRESQTEDSDTSDPAQLYSCRQRWLWCHLQTGARIDDVAPANIAADVDRWPTQSRVEGIACNGIKLIKFDLNKKTIPYINGCSLNHQPFKGTSTIAIDVHKKITPLKLNCCIVLRLPFSKGCPSFPLD